MTYDFDTIIPREGTQAVKLEMLGTYFGDKDLLPLWVADMDFATPDFVLEAIRARAEHPILGYTLRSEGFHQAFLGWLEQRHQWRAEREWIRFSPGVVPGLALAVQAFTQPGDKVLVQPPVYPPFFGVVENQGRQLLENPLREEGGRYHMDFDDLERKAAQGAKMLLLCSPQNPGGNVWRPDELERLAQVCQRHGLLVVADEVHADLVFPGFRHTPYPSLGEAAAQHSITFMAPSKTFNCAGLGTSLAIIPNPEIRAAYDKHLHNAHLHFGNIFGSVGTQAAYEQGGPWLDQLMDYLLGNLDFAEAFLAEHAPQVKLWRPEGTYLAWLDFRQVEPDGKRLKELLVGRAKVALNDGRSFRGTGEGFARLNLAHPRAILAEGLRRIAEAVANHPLENRPSPTQT